MDTACPLELWSELNVGLSGFCRGCYESLLYDRQRYARIDQSVCQHLKAFEKTLSMFSNSASQLIKPQSILKL